MNHLAAIESALEKEWGGKTLATLHDAASKEFNGTCFSALRFGNGRRCVLAACVTGAHEIGKALPALRAAKELSFGEWAFASLIEVAGRTMLAGGLCYVARRESNRLTALVFIAADPDSLTMIEALFGLSD